jgi:hypothetical protein
MSPLTKKFLFSALVMMVLISACAPAQPTQSPEEIANQVATSVALTVAAQNAQTQAAQPVVPEATNTTLPTQTEVPCAPQRPSPTDWLFADHSRGGGGVALRRARIRLQSVSLSPQDTRSSAREPFDIKYTTPTQARGNGRRPMSNITLDQLTSTTIVELPRLEPGEQTVVDMDAVAPEREGSYIMTFIVEGGLCYPYTAIVVERP